MTKTLKNIGNEFMWLAGWTLFFVRLMRETTTPSERGSSNQATTESDQTGLDAPLFANGRDVSEDDE